MEDWIGALKSVQKWETYEVGVFSSLQRPPLCSVIIYSAGSEHRKRAKLMTLINAAHYDCVIYFDENRLHTSLLNFSSICILVLLSWRKTLSSSSSSTPLSSTRLSFTLSYLLFI